MASMTRRAWLTTLGAAPVVGGLVAWGESKVAPKESVRAGEKLSPRERLQREHLPNVELITHEGKKVRFYDDLVKDKKVAITFMYATCEGICVPTTVNMVRVQKMFGDRVGKDIFFYSLTLKPEEDTPEALKKYAEMHGVGPGWLFLTGNPENIEAVRVGLGFYYVFPEEDEDTSNHVGMVRVGVEPLMFWGACQGLANPHHIYRVLKWEFDRPLPGRVS